MAGFKPQGYMKDPRIRGGVQSMLQRQRVKGAQARQLPGQDLNAPRQAVNARYGNANAPRVAQLQPAGNAYQNVHRNRRNEQAGIGRPHRPPGFNKYLGGRMRGPRFGGPRYPGTGGYKPPTLAPAPQPPVRDGTVMPNPLPAPTYPGTGGYKPLPAQPLPAQPQPVPTYPGTGGYKPLPVQPQPAPTRLSPTSFAIKGG